MLDSEQVAFWEKRWQEAMALGFPHWAVINESIEFWERINEVTKRNLRQVFDIFRPQSVLDIGCGIGNLSEYLPEGVSYTGVDIAPSYVAFAAQKYPNRLFYVRDLLTESADFPTHDIVICRGFEGTISKRYGRTRWEQLETEILKLTKTVIVSLGLYQSHRYDVIFQGRHRLHCIEGDVSADSYHKNRFLERVKVCLENLPPVE